MEANKRIVIIEPSEIIRKGISDILSELNQYELVASYSDCIQVAERCHSARADILLFNPLMMSSVQRNSIRSFYSVPDQIKLIAIIYSFIDELTLQQFDAVININDNATKINNKLHSLKETQNEEQKSDTEELSERENEILISLVKGLTNKEIADKHFISVHTVISHRKNIVRKTGIKSVSGLTVYALINNLISYEDVD